MIAIYTISLALPWQVSFAPAARASNEPDLLARQLRATVIKGKTIDEVLEVLTSEYEIPIGIELGDQKLVPDRKIYLNLPETNVKEFLDSLLAKDPRYTWRLEGGTIRVWPVKGRDALLGALLDTKISHFAFTEDDSRYRIYSDILNLPEIQTQLVVADVAPMVFLSSGTMRKVGKGISFEGSNLTLRELLDRVILTTDSKRWLLRRWGKNNEYITLRS